jgi:hypothetical protein
VVPTRGDAGGGVVRGADAAWDVALAVVVVSPAGDRAVVEHPDEVKAPAGDLECLFKHQQSSSSVLVGVPMPIGTSHWS